MSLVAPSLATSPRSTRRWAARARATWLSYRGAAIVDVETTDFDGRICEVAIIDTAGRTLANTLVNPQVPVTAAASAVHGITDVELVSAPTWEVLAPSVSWLLRDRPVIAYNAPFDQGVITREMDRVGHQWRPESPWWCLMRARSDVEGLPWRALNGGHRALGDCRAALEVLQTLSWGSAHRAKEASPQPPAADRPPLP